MSKRNKYIERQLGGWQLCLFRHNTDQYTETFNDRKCNGRAKALAKAIERRYNILKKHNKLHLLNANKPAVYNCNKRNTSGVIGLSIKQSEYYSWEAHGMFDGVTWSKGFSVNRFGEKEAFQLACEARYKKHGKLTVTCNLKDLLAKPRVPYVISKCTR